jgi:aspartate racemase
MKTLGIIGGIAPGSTIEYYRLLIETARERTNGAYPPVIIDSIDLTRMMGLVSAGRLEALTGYLLSELERLARAGAEVALLASNTPHLVFDALRARAPLPLISIVEAARDAGRSLGLQRLVLLGTGSTMRAGFYSDVFARAGMSVVVPREDEQAYTHDVYMNELVNGVFRDESRDGILRVVRRMIADDGIDGVILGGTELPLLIRPENQAGVPFLDTTRIHVARAVEEMLAQSRPSVASAFS